MTLEARSNVRSGQMHFTGEFTARHDCCRSDAWGSVDRRASQRTKEITTLSSVVVQLCRHPTVEHNQGIYTGGDGAFTIDMDTREFRGDGQRGVLRGAGSTISAGATSNRRPSPTRHTGGGLARPPFSPPTGGIRFREVHLLKINKSPLPVKQFVLYSSGSRHSLQSYVWGQFASR